jgi:hypothetical protein
MSKSKSEQAFEVESAMASPDLKPIEHWRDILGTPDWLFAATKVGKGWAIGQEVTQAVYEKAVRWAAGTPLEGEDAVVCR